jgi:predicted DNA-binding antitoxin AbrB/MazE fold protein
MTLTVEAAYENGIHKLDHPLPLSEQQRVRVIIHAGPSRASQSYGLLKWTGSVEDLARQGIMELFTDDGHAQRVGQGFRLVP